MRDGDESRTGIDILAGDWVGERHVVFQSLFGLMRVDRNRDKMCDVCASKICS